MFKITVITAFVLLAGAEPLRGDYPGSIVNSWNGKYQGKQAPFSVAYGDGYVWLCHETFITKRLRSTGSVVGLVRFSGWFADDMAFDEEKKYLYCACWDKGVYVRDSKTGSNVASFGVPVGARFLTGIGFDISKPAKPLWLGDEVAWRLWNVTSNGSVVRSIKTSFGNVSGIAYDGDTVGGPYLFVGTKNKPPTIYAFRPGSGSVLYSFRAPAPIYAGALGGLAWDGQYLWTVNDRTGSRDLGMVYQFIGHGDFGVTPGSFGKIKCLYR
jgi:hypothetical protein